MSCKICDWNQVDEMDLWERQHALAAQLDKAEVIHLLQSLMDKSKERTAAFAWGIANVAFPADSDGVQLCPQVDAIKVKQVQSLSEWT